MSAQHLQRTSVVPRDVRVQPVIAVEDVADCHPLQAFEGRVVRIWRPAALGEAARHGGVLGSAHLDEKHDVLPPRVPQYGIARIEDRRKRCRGDQLSGFLPHLAGCRLACALTQRVSLATNEVQMQWAPTQIGGLLGLAGPSQIGR